MTNYRRTRADAFEPARTIASLGLQWDVDRLLSGFETDTATARRDERLLRPLQAIGRHDLAEDLAPRIYSLEVPPAWSNGWYRDFRRWFTDQAVNLAWEAKEKSGQLGVTVSIIPAAMTAPAGRLSEIVPRDAAHRAWKSLHKVLEGYRVIGGVDLSFNERAGEGQPAGYYQGQLAFAVLGYPSDKESCQHLRKALKTAFDLEPAAAIPVQVKVLRDPVEQLSYLMKRMFVRRVSIIDKRGRRNTLARPLKPAQEAEIAAWLSSFPQTDRMILKGLRRQGDKIVPTGPCRKQEDGE